MGEVSPINPHFGPEPKDDYSDDIAALAPDMGIFDSSVPDLQPEKFVTLRRIAESESSGELLLATIKELGLVAALGARIELEHQVEEAAEDYRQNYFTPENTIRNDKVTELFEATQDYDNATVLRTLTNLKSRVGERARPTNPTGRAKIALPTSRTSPRNNIFEAERLARIMILNSRHG